jgi:iron-sulfur cluster assembly protein
MIQLSPTAAQEILRLRSRRSDPDLRLRLRVQATGCLGLLYGMEFDRQVGEEDRTYESNGVAIVIDADSLRQVDGLRVDYSEDLMGGGFRFHNPSAAQTCGCGNSFSLNPAS